MTGTIIRYADKKPDGYYAHIYESALQLELCGVSHPYEIEMWPSETGCYWGWLSNGRVSLIYASLDLLSLCFPGGLEASEQAGSGIRIQLDAKEIRQCK